MDEIIARYPARNPLKVPQVDKQTLSNGLRLYLLEDRSLPTVSVSVRINCGAYLEPADKVGLADVCGEVMRTGGTTKWTGDQIDELLEGVGASVETGIDLLYGTGSMNTLTEYTDLGLEVLAQVLQHPVFDQDKIELAKVNQRSAIARRNDDADQIGQREFRKVIYGAGSPYTRQPEYATISAISRDDLVAFHKAWFHPENVQIAVWGDFKKADMVARMNKYFGKWTRGTTPVPPPPKVDYKFTPKVHYVEKNDVNQSKIYVGHIGGLQTDPNYPDVIVMNAILGGSFGSRLFNSVRSREGLAYAVFGVYTANVSYPGIFYNFASTKSETTGKAIREIIKEVKRMQTDAPTPEEMKVGKDGYLNSFVFQFESKAQVINRLLNYDFYGLPSDFNVKLKDRIETCTPDAVQAAAKSLLHPDALQILVVGKGKDFEVPLADLGLGSVDTIDISIPSGEPKRDLAISDDNLKKGKALLDKAVAAHGGLVNFKNIKGLLSKGTITFTTPQGDMPISVEDLKAYPNQFRSTMLAMGQQIVEVNNGMTGWKTDPRTRSLVAKSEEDMVKDKQEWGRDLVSVFQTSDKPEYKAVYDGNGTVQGSTVEWVALVGKGGDQLCRLGLNPESGQLVCREFVGETMAGEGKIEEVFETFSDVSGVKLPSGSTRFVAGQKFIRISLTELLVNPSIAPGAFEKPQ
ncbi:MAG: insulinase family protein [candidate division Zixibacteria bacterium]|nr:insulinase family protein [candidate division Zixibacteria bacterium]